MLLITKSVRTILHDWPPDKCCTILKLLREAAGPSSKLIVFDMIMPYACEYNGPFADVVNTDKPPSPLLANLGMGLGGFKTWIDVHVSLRTRSSLSAFAHKISDDEHL